jgi:leucyl-tRNA synthetase
LFILFAAPVENELRWSESGIEGAVRFLRKIYTMVWRWHERLSNTAGGTNAPISEEIERQVRALRRKTHQTIAKVTSDFDDLHLNTIVAALMELFNELSDLNAEPAAASEAEVFAVKEALEALVLMLAPFAPHVAEEVWEELGHDGGILKSGRWPQADPELARREELEIPIQVNGKLRSRILASPEVTEEELRTAALNDEKILTFIQGHKVVKVIVVPQRLVNVVVR